MKNRKAFTLIEVLLATAILATILVMTTATVGQTSTYRGKLIETRKAGEAVRSVAEMLSSDLREKTVPGTLEYIDPLTSASTSLTFNGGVAQLYCSDTRLRSPKDMDDRGGCVVVNNQGPYYGLISHGNGGDPYLNTASSAGDPYAYDPIAINDSYPANALIIFLPGNKAKIYWSSRDILLNESDTVNNYILAKWAYSLYYKEISLTDPALAGAGLKIGQASDINWWSLLGVSSSANRITQFTDGEFGIIFGGYCPDEASLAGGLATSQQPHVRFFVGARTLRYNADTTKASRGYGYLPATDRGAAEIQSMITLRKYTE